MSPFVLLLVIFPGVVNEQDSICAAMPTDGAIAGFWDLPIGIVLLEPANVGAMGPVF